MSERDLRLYLSDISDSAGAIVEYVKGLSFEEFCSDRKTQSAVVREFEIIGEAVGRLSDESKRKHPEVEWQDIKDFRNLLTHEYFGIDLEIVWKIVNDDLPTLIRVVGELLGEESK
jgi:uncharacterized protein with HEPN domain